MHKKEMESLDSDIIEMEKSSRLYRERCERNGELMGWISKEVTESVIKKLFRENEEYLRDIMFGRRHSQRHSEYHKDIKSRHALFYKAITNPFTDDQIKWTMGAIKEVGNH